ncbi:hypothetical protein [Ferrovibrio sp.]|uniref:hypothetical protein n=1 Tax=Ferrovibrio sp. TaxID=1917215 RepID=UPI000CBE0D8C|nr:hypothetical protein [Ferrovibrio sp.]PJI40403.1 MAG: hypothetical protein CTR53_10355 [Ferrovibrio sp.]
MDKVDIEILSAWIVFVASLIAVFTFGVLYSALPLFTGAVLAAVRYQRYRKLHAVEADLAAMRAELDAVTKATQQNSSQLLGLSRSIPGMSILPR